jgi:hypothetical protein
MDPDSILSGWVGTSQSVVVHLNNNANNDDVTVFDASNSTQLNLGTVSLHGNYTAANVTFGASGTASSIVQSGSTITITLGTASGAVNTVGANTKMTWPPSASATDRAGNACSTTSINEGGANDSDF